MPTAGARSMGAAGGGRRDRSSAPSWTGPLRLFSLAKILLASSSRLLVGVVAGQGLGRGGLLDRQQHLRVGIVLLALRAALGGAFDLEVEFELRAQPERHRVHRRQIGGVKWLQ